MNTINQDNIDETVECQDVKTCRSVSKTRVPTLNEPQNCTKPTGTCGQCPLRQDCTDAELVEACRSGSTQAHRHLYEIYRPRILSLMLKMTGNTEEASDLTQDALVRVLNRLGDFRGEAALGTWIHRVAVNEALQHIRRKKRLARITGNIAEETRHGDTVSEDLSVSIDVNEALGRLPERMRTMVRLRYQDGLDYSEIAQTMGVKQGTVASGLNRARQQLRAILS